MYGDVDTGAGKTYKVAPEEHDPSTAALALWREIDRLGLAANIAELEIKGFTVVPPEKLGPPEFAARLREAVLDVAERRNGGLRPDIEHADDLFPKGAKDRRDTIATNFGQRLTYMLYEDPVFIEAAMNPVALALATYLVGAKCAIYSTIAFLKGPGGGDLALHCDHIKMCDPFPAVTQVCNTTWLLSDYNRDNGSIAFVPGSHRKYRNPNFGEGLEHRVPIDAPAGSLVFWGGNTWHGAFARKNPGLRMTYATFYCRPAIMPQEDVRSRASDEFLSKYPKRLQTLVGRWNNYGWREEGPQFEDVAYSVGQSWYD